MSIVYKDSKGKKYQMRLDGETWNLFYQKPTGTNWYLVDVEKFEEKEELEEKTMLEYAKENGLVPQNLGKLLQGVTFEISDYIKLNLNDRGMAVQKYFCLEEDIKTLENQRDVEIKEAKTTYKKLIEEKKKALLAVKPEARDGLKEEKTWVSEERLVLDQKMVTVRVDNLKPLKIRDMNGEEKSVNDVFDVDHENPPAFDDDDIPADHEDMPGISDEDIPAFDKPVDQNYGESELKEIADKYGCRKIVNEDGIDE